MNARLLPEILREWPPMPNILFHWRNEGGSGHGSPVSLKFNSRMRRR